MTCVYACFFWCKRERETERERERERERHRQTERERERERKEREREREIKRTMVLFNEKAEPSARLFVFFLMVFK